MSVWRERVDEEPPAEFLRLLYDQRSDDEADQEDNVSEDFSEESEEDELGDISDEDRNLSPEAPLNIPIKSPEHDGSLSEMDYDLSSPEAPPYSPLTSPECREQSPELEPQETATGDRSRSPISFHSLEFDDVVLHMDDGEREQVEEDIFLAPDTHVLYGSQREQERDRDVRIRSVNVRRGGRRSIRGVGVRGQSGRGRGHPNWDRRRDFSGKWDTH